MTQRRLLLICMVIVVVAGPITITSCMSGDDINEANTKALLASDNWEQYKIIADNLGVPAGALLSESGYKAVKTSANQREQAATAASMVQVTYRVTGTANTVRLTYENASGNTEQKDPVRVPWTATYTMPRGAFVYISAQNNGNTSGSVVCEILVNGVVIEQAESSGKYVIASCRGTAGR